MSGEHTAVSEGGPVDLEGWDLNALEISPPPGFEGVIDGELHLTDLAFNGAEVTSVNSFSFTVGDANAPDQETLDAEEVILALDSEPSSQQDGWDADLSDNADDGAESDVMGEAIVILDGPDATEVTLDSYERADW